jgi:hypothetical protein
MVPRESGRTTGVIVHNDAHYGGSSAALTTRPACDQQIAPVGIAQEPLLVAPWPLVRLTRDEEVTPGRIRPPRPPRTISLVLSVPEAARRAQRLRILLNLSPTRKETQIVLP